MAGKVLFFVVKSQFWAAAMPETCGPQNLDGNARLTH